MTDAKYTVSVTPSFDGLVPKFSALIYRMVKAGVCGPFSDEPVLSSLDEVDRWLNANGFTRVSGYGQVCAAGFASADLVVSESVLNWVLRRCPDPHHEPAFIGGK